MKLSEHFTQSEFEKSQYATRHGIDNTMGGDALSSAKALCESILEPLRVKIQTPIIISSGFRCSTLNAEIGGASHSQHVYGMAADIEAIALTNFELASLIKNMGLPYDQLIFEGRWVHVSHAVYNRGEVLTADFSRKGVTYRTGLHES